MDIEVWSDFICPFCYIGKRRLELALDQFPHKKKVAVTYNSYELDPNAERNPGKSIHELMAEKFGMSVEEARKSSEELGRQANELGLTYNFDTMQHTNTFDAHRVAQYAKNKGKEHAVTERLLRAYFTDSERISDHDTLARLAADAGLDRGNVRALLKRNDYADDVRIDEKEAAQLGVQGVPFFVFNSKYALSGAQPLDVFKEVLEKVWEEEQSEPSLQSLTPKKSKTTYCTDEGCKIEEDD
ncbi:DsbA family oxidoreductase [Lentibacillus cibarius]|uniref:DsbA family oxidoreductase n=1 Tax=Lentibacillus cibarius TaxID=2583219 RepID=A0A5S3QL70_9BACI|nr:DsbA family oxidoreductase [Lentibacillus cibarius]TMN22509.1 DsbA family oxidoreductase [Lentibacillus cibarius]